MREDSKPQLFVPERSERQKPKDSRYPKRTGDGMKKAAGVRAVISVILRPNAVILSVDPQSHHNAPVCSLYDGLSKSKICGSRYCS
uniref:Uncharacterized protein n=1 Tax=Anguilla anguilla TaxID=7936 RepID=A0A0E9WJE7_ANGAN